MSHGDIVVSHGAILVRHGAVLISHGVVLVSLGHILVSQARVPSQQHTLAYSSSESDSRHCRPRLRLCHPRQSPAPEPAPRPAERCTHCTESCLLETSRAPETKLTGDGAAMHLEALLERCVAGRASRERCETNRKSVDHDSRS